MDSASDFESGGCGFESRRVFLFLPDKNVRNAVFQCVDEAVFASIAQLAEHLPRKQKVSSSNLDGGCRAVGLEV